VNVKASELIGLSVRVAALNGRGFWEAVIVQVMEADKRFVKVRGVSEIFGADRWVEVVMTKTYSKRAQKRLDDWCEMVDREQKEREAERAANEFVGDEGNGRKIRADEL
jgi:hypothetical protein